MNKNVTFSLSQETIERLDEISKKTRLKKSIIVDESLREFFEKWEASKNV